MRFTGLVLRETKTEPAKPFHPENRQRPLISLEQIRPSRPPAGQAHVYHDRSLARAVPRNATIAPQE
jgi:hypothetical protein